MANKEMHIHVGDYCFFFIIIVIFILLSHRSISSHKLKGEFLNLSNSHISPMR